MVKSQTSETIKCTSSFISRKYIITLLLLALSIYILGCSDGTKPEDQQNISIKLKWMHQAQFTGNYVAMEKGFYQKHGMNAKLFQYNIGENLIQDVEDGIYDFGITGADELVIAHAKGAKVKAVAVIYKKSPVCAYTLDKNIKHPKDFIGKKIGIMRGINVEYLYHVMMERMNINKSQTSEVAIGPDASEIPAGLVDIATGYAINEPNILIAQGYDVNVLLMSNYGADTYADVLITSENKISENPKQVQAYVSATLEGWNYALGNQEESISYTMKYADTQTEHQRLMFRESIPFIYYDTEPVGWMNHDRWQSLAELLRERGIISEDVVVDNIYINDFVENYYNNK